LQTNDCESNEQRPGVAAHELADFRMRLDDGARPPGMGMTKLRVKKGLLHENYYRMA
jgi:hypothetical protein